MFKKVVIANRGEIALRILRACHQLGIETVALYSTADKNLPHIQLANESLCIGPASSQNSYLNMQAIITAANITGADAIHPGYGFLAESAEFAELVTRSGFTFIGPSADVIRLMGDKVSAIDAMLQSGVPTVPGSNGALPNDPTQIVALAESIGYPIIIKAAGGGGGRGMRQVDCESDLLEAVAITRNEAASFFANDSVYMEKFLISPRHIEVQILADNFGKVLHLGDRDCSIQRRHQKLIEEAPAVGILESDKQQLADQCINACKKIGYQGAGTFEFLYQNGHFYFIEMNTRLQVEHTISEMITGVDIVQAQLLIAANEPLSLEQTDIHLSGHAIECRVNAENPQTGHPSPGIIEQLNIPGGKGVRWDSQIHAGFQVSGHYDSMIAKLICHGNNRASCINLMQQALSELTIEGIDSNVRLHQNILQSTQFSHQDADHHHQVPVFFE